MNVLSLFDGISCGRVALERACIEVENYYASEIDKFAIQVSAANWPDIQQVGDVVKFRRYFCASAGNLEKMKSYQYLTTKTKSIIGIVEKIKRVGIDVLIGGSPCQGFSFAGKGLNFDDPRSALFFEYVRILNEIRKTNPDVIFLLENVPMKREHQMVISKYLGVYPIGINGALVSAQNRRRLFWTNIKAQPFNLFGDTVSMIPQPTDKGVLLKDILQSADEVDRKYYLSDRRVEFMLKKQGQFTQLNGEKSMTVTARGDVGWQGDFLKIAVDGTLSPNQGKSSCFTAGGNSAGNHSDMDLIFIEQTPRGNNNGGQKAMNGKTPSVTSNHWEHNNHLRVHNMMPRSSKTGKGGSGHLSKPGDKTYCIDTGQTNVIELPNNWNGGAYHQSDRVDMPHRKCRTIESHATGGFERKTFSAGQYRRLTPIEVERLFTLPENYTASVSDSQRYRCMGSGWIVDVIAHILSHIEK